MKDFEGKKIYTVRELAAVCRISYKTTLKLLESGQVPAVRVGRQWRVSRGTVERLLNSDEGKKEKPVGENVCSATASGVD